LRIEKFIDGVKNKEIFKRFIVGCYQKLSNEPSIYPDKKRLMLNKSNRISDCMSFWIFDKYNKNKILDLKRVNRCKDAFCPNCKKLKVAKTIKKMAVVFKRIPFLYDNVIPVMITLTVPNTDNLPKTLKDMTFAILKFWRWLDLENPNSFKGSMFDIIGMIRFLEITFNEETMMFHPHFHILAFINNCYEPDLWKDAVLGGKNYRTGEDVIYSKADLFIQKLWKYAFENKDIRTFNKASDNWYENLIADIRVIDDIGLLEVCKYVVKDNINNYQVFKILYNSLKNKKTIQGYGCFFNVESEEKEEIEEEKFLEFEETPEEIYFNSIRELANTFRDFKKISRYGSHKYIDDVQD
jgi:plasmid rolling circle replication initiator protein Rep